MLPKSMTRQPVLFLLLGLCAVPALAETDEEIAKKSQNPVAAMISVPFKNKFEFDRGPG